jgi:GAF domain-containing protein
LQSGKPAKILALGSRSNNEITTTALQPFGNLAEVAGTAFDRFEVMRMLNQRLNELQTLANVSETISAETDLDRLYSSLHDQVSNSIGTDIGFVVALYHEDSNTIEVPYIYDGGETTSVESYPMGEGLTSYIIKTGKSLLLTKDVEDEALKLGTRIMGAVARSWMGIPLAIGGRVVGAMILQDMSHEERFSTADLNLMSTLAPQVATAINNARLLTEMQKAISAYDEERFLLNSLLDVTPDQILFKDLEGAYLRVSNSAASAGGFSSPTELIGKTDFDLFGEDVGVDSYRDEQEVLSTGQNIETIIEQPGADESIQSWLLTSRIPLTDSEGLTAGMLEIRRDITNLKKAEELSQLRADQIRTAAEIARESTTSLQSADVLMKSVNLIRDRYGFYHASVFLVDPIGEFAILRESTGEAGQQMKERGHKLAVGSQSIIGQATALGQALVVNNVLGTPNYYPNPLLPDTRSEMAVPLKIGERTIGALDIQSIKLNAFSDEDVSVMQVLADQIAIAVSNAELFAKTQDHITKHRLLHQIISATSSSTSIKDAFERAVESLHMTLGEDRVAIFTMTPNNHLSIAASSGYEGVDIQNLEVSLGEGLVGQVAADHKSILAADTASQPSYIPLDPSIRSELAVPIMYGDRLLGVLDLESPRVAAYDENDLEIITTLGTNLGSVISNIQLLQRIREQIDRQQQIFDITSRIRQSVDIHRILETSATELAHALKLRHTQVEISTDRITAADNPTLSETKEQIE